MIEVKNGEVKTIGQEDEVLKEYAATTGILLEELFSKNRFNSVFGEQLSPESRAAAAFMANLETAVSKHTSFNDKEFYDALFRLVRFVRNAKIWEGTHES